MTSLDPRTLALHLARVIDDKSGVDIQVLELPKGQLADLVVIATGRSDRQVHTLAAEARRFCRDQDFHYKSVQGQSGWIILDCFDVVVHALTQEMREFYRLERLWPEAAVLDWETLAKDVPRLAPPSPAEDEVDYYDAEASADDSDEDDDEYDDDEDDEDDLDDEDDEESEEDDDEVDR